MNKDYYPLKIQHFLKQYTESSTFFVSLLGNFDQHMTSITNVKINLPLSFCEFAIRNNFFSPLQLYIYLKTICRGQILLDAAYKKEVAKELGVSPKTVGNLLKKLQERNWVGYNAASGYFFIRGFDKVRELEQLRGRRGVWVDASKDVQNKARFKALAVGAIIGQMANVSKYKMRERVRYEPEHIKGSSNHRSHQTVPSHFPIACKALSSMLTISSSTASLYKELANQHGFIEVKKQWERLKLTGNPKERDADFAAAYKVAHPDVAHRVRIRDGKVFLQETDLIRPLLTYTKKWRLRK